MRGTMYTDATSHVPDNLLARILASRDHLSEGERPIADFLLAHQANVSNLPQADLARACSVSPATVSRFCRKMGEKDYRGFQMSFLRMQNTLHGGPLGIEMPTDDISIDDVPGAVREVLNRRVADLRLTLEGLDPTALEASARAIATARVVEFAAVGRSIPTAMDAAYKFERIGILAVTASYYEKLISEALALSSTDVLVVFSRSGWSGTLQQVASAAQSREATVVAVTGNLASPIAQKANHVLTVASGDVSSSELTGNTRIGELAIMEVLFTLVAATRPDAAARKADNERHIFSEVDLP